MDSEPKDYGNPFLEKNIQKTVIEEDPSKGYTKVFKQYLRPGWPDYQEETFAGSTMDWRELSLREEQITGVELRRVRNNTQITLAQEDERIGMTFTLVLPEKRKGMILSIGFDNKGKISHMLAHALPRRPFYTQGQTDRLENPTIDIGEQTIDIKGLAKSLGVENFDDVKLGNPLVAEFKDSGPTEFKCHVLRSEPEQEPLSISYNKDFPLMERRFRLGKKSGLFTLHQQPLTLPFFICTITFPDAIHTETAKDKLRDIGKGWRNFFDQYQISVEFSQTK